MAGMRVKKWRDQHPNTCPCKKCEAKPKHVPDKPVDYKAAKPLDPPFASGGWITSGLMHIQPGVYEVLQDPNSANVVTIEGSTITVNSDLYNGEITVKDGIIAFTPAPVGDVFSWNGFYPLKTNFGSWITSEPSEPPTVELLDSSNPFAKALDAWQTGKAGWTKGALFRRDHDERQSA